MKSLTETIVDRILDKQGMSMMEMMKPVTSPDDFLRKMIPHHELALTMANQVLALKPPAAVRDLAENILSSQTKQIAMMKELLKA